MKLKIHFKNLFGMFFTLSGIFIIALFINITLGIVLIFSLLCFMLLSPSLMLLFYKRLKIKLEVNGDTFNKGDSIILKTEFDFQLPFSMFIINAKLIENEFLHYSGDNAAFSGLCDKENPLSFSALYISSAFGKDTIGIESLVLRDFMSLASLSLDTDELKKEIKTLPKLNTIFYKGELVNSCLFSSDFDDSQEIATSAMLGNGSLGYEHRKYIEGDSPKRINWKLSAKKNELLVRLEEPTAVSKQLIVLNSLSGTRLENEKTVEAMLAFVDFLIRNKVCCQIYVLTEKGYIDLTLFSPQDIKKLLDLCSNASFVDSDISNLKINTEDFNSIIFFTACLGKETLIKAESFSLKPFIITAQKNFNGENIYKISAGLSIVNSLREVTQ